MKLKVKDGRPFYEFDGQLQYEDIQQQELDEGYVDREINPQFIPGVQPMSEFYSMTSKIYKEK